MKVEKRQKVKAYSTAKPRYLQLEMTKDKKDDNERKKERAER